MLNFDAGLHAKPSKKMDHAILNKYCCSKILLVYTGMEATEFRKASHTLTV